MGFALRLCVSCEKCDWKHYLFTSEECGGNDGRGRIFVEVNIRSAIAFREIGKGTISTFSQIMNMQTLTHSAVTNIYDKMLMRILLMKAYP